jgi:uncharacterized protein
VNGRSARSVVLDTNVLLDLWLFDDPSVRSLREAIDAGILRPLRTTETDAEFVEVLQRARFGLGESARATVLERWAACSEPSANVEPAPLVCSDPDDQKFLDVAFSGGADLLLTRDKALLQLARRAEAAGLLIRSPAATMTYDRYPHESNNGLSASSSAPAVPEAARTTDPAAHYPVDVDGVCRRDRGAGRG